MSNITIDNVKAIEHLEIPIPEDGGVVVIRGGQGVGKSTALAATQRLAGGNIKGLEIHDGAKRGTVEFGECRLTVTRSRTQTKGELECESLEGKLDLAALVDPGIADPVAADGKRIKALVNLSGVSADPSVYYDVVGGEEKFRELDLEPTDDPILLSSRVKRAIEAKARTVEKAAENASGKYQSLKEATKGIDTKVTIDEAELRKQHTAAIEEHSRLEERRRSNEKLKADRVDAKSKLSKLEAEYDGPSVEEAKKAVEKEQEAVDHVRSVVAEAEKILQEAKHRHSLAAAALGPAENHFKNLETLKEVLDVELEEVASDDIEKAEAAVKDAEANLEKGLLAREAKKQIEQANEHKEASKKLKKEADGLRKASQRVDKILSSLIPEGPLRVEMGRLTCETDRSKSELFTDLSEGERWKIAIDIAASQLPAHGLLVIPQHAFEGLTESSRQEINNHAKKRKVVILTAEAVDGPIEAEPMEAVI